MRVFMKLFLFRRPYTVCYITKDVFMLPDELFYKEIGLNIGDCYDDIGTLTLRRTKRVKFTINALFLQPFLKECVIFDAYRYNVIKNVYQKSHNQLNEPIFLKLILEPPDQEIIDYEWNDRMNYLIWTRVEIENAFSWLSTLGGAYSALGDYFDHCAEEAGRISLRQYKLSRLLGDDGLAARSKLYSSIAYAQRGKLKLARYIVRDIAAFARQTHDRRLNRMCQGVWAKLKYLRTLKSSKVKEECNKPVVNMVGRGDEKFEMTKMVCVK
ncbi:PREDICTED: uncharacterized protein F58A4.6 [Papilio xuthus]|uniref:Uncharacterized protein F58A4.6 n=1 Tax=Papilio xuthus TaxID=66420 RepID=A0AAJ6Z8W3_PAPXU|nr:PREDICTED: uncharacterized protein F58A4.6 [Papilio xuthus]